VKRSHVARPCANCPFRREGGIRLRPGRIREILGVVTPDRGPGGTFPCHKTVNHDARDHATELECAGALIFAYKQGTSTQMMRISERLGLMDPDLATGDHPEIFDDADEWLETAEDR
jgi:hypothetical protein